MTDAESNPESGDLQDDALRRALLHAPDHAAVPGWRLRKAILQKAHEAVAVADGALLGREEKRPWWRAGGWGGGGARMPWNAAFATLLVATLVTVLWQREPVPGPRSDSEKQAAAPAAALAPPPSPKASASGAAAGRSAPAPTAVPSPASPAASQAVPSLLPELQSTEPPAPPLAADDAAPANNIALFGPDLSDAAKQGAPKAASPPAATLPRQLPAPARSAAPSADSALRPALPASRAERARKEEEGALMPRFAAPAAPVPAPPPPPPGAAASLARSAPPAAATVRTETTEPPTFEALSQWTRITIAQRGGASRSLTRADAGALDALMGSAAISAVGAQPLAGAPEWRVTLERGKDVLAVLELGRNQVRWREGRSPPATGAPSAPALDALRGALREAVQPPPAPAQAEPARPEPAPPAQEAPPAEPPRTP
jgi:hypothetical protein